MRKLSVNTVIENIIREKPHLADPLRFYQKTQTFFQSVNSFSPAISPHEPAYSARDVETIMERFSSLLELPEGTLAPLKQAMELGEIDFTRLPLGEVPAFSLPYAEDDLTMLLYLLSKPYFHALREQRGLDDRLWEEGKCPLCNAQPALSWTGEEDRRKVCCPFCGSTGYVGRSSCPICLREDASKQRILAFEKEEGFAVNTCDLCRSYVKTVDEPLIARYSPDIADIVSLPLDIIVQEKGYQRRSPNPLGMRKITMRG